MGEMMKKLEEVELESVAGGLSIPDTGYDPAATRAQKDLFAKENAAAVAGMGLEKIQGTGGKNVRAFCPVCRKETTFHVSSGARTQCSVCGNIRLDL